MHVKLLLKKYKALVTGNSLHEIVISILNYMHCFQRNGRSHTVDNYQIGYLILGYRK